MTEFEQIIELSVDADSFRFDKRKLKQQFPLNSFENKKEMLPFELDVQNNSMFVKNSEYRHESWFIENPISKDLTKRITLKLSPKAK